MQTQKSFMIFMGIMEVLKLSELNKIEKEIFKLENKRDSIKEANFKEASKHWFTLLNAEFESSSTRTKQYLTFCRVFKRQFKKLLNETFDIENIEISKPNHFDAYGFFELANGRIYCFSVGDLRWNMTFMIRTARNFEDHTGGSNDYCNTEDFESFMRDLKSIVDNSPIDKNLYNFEHEKCQIGLYMATKKDARNTKCSKCKNYFLEVDQ